MERHFKQVKGKTVVVPTLADVQSLVPQGVHKVTDTAPIRHELARRHAVDMACPFTVRRHLRTLKLL